MWVCGLKLKEAERLTKSIVAPYVGVWIETHCMICLCHKEKSHPMWVCGLKQIISRYIKE